MSGLLRLLVALAGATVLGGITALVPDPHEQPTLSVEEGGRLLSLGRSAAYTQASRYLATGGAEGLPVISFGRRLVCPTAKILALLGLGPDSQDAADGASGG